MGQFRPLGALMKSEDKTRFLILFSLLATIYIAACLVEKCDGHACDHQTTYED